MAADAASRKTVRDALTALLSAALVGVGKPVQNVVGYPLDYDISKETPYLCVTSFSTFRPALGGGNTRYNDVFVLQLMAFFRAADNANGWTESLLEDKIDLVEKEIADCIADNRQTANWSFAGYSSEIMGQASASDIVVDAQRGCVVELQKIYIHVIEAQ